MTKTGTTILVIIILLAGAIGYGVYKNNSSTTSPSVPVQTVTDNKDTTSSGPSPEAIASPTPDVSVSVGVSTMKSFTVTGSNFAFIPSTIMVKKGDTVKITFKNTSGFHDLRVDGYNVGTKQMQAGNEETFSFVADKAGSFEYYCSVGTHRQMGMKGILTVK